MKKSIFLILTVLFVPIFSYGATIGKVIVPETPLKWERQQELDEIFHGKFILIYSSEGQEVLVGLPDKGDEVKKGAIGDTISRKLKEVDSDHRGDVETLNFGGRTWYGIAQKDEDMTHYSGFINSGLTVYQVDIIIEAQGIIPESIKHFLSKIKIQKSVVPTNLAQMISKGNLYVDQKEYSKAIKTFDQAIKIDPMNPEASYFRGLCNKKMKNYFEARIDLQTAMLMKESADLKKNADFMVTAANIEILAKDFDKAKSWIAKALEINPEHDGAYQSLAHAYRFSGEFDKSIKTYEKSLKLNPSNKSARSDLIKLYLYKKENLTAAQEHLKKFKSYHPLDKRAEWLNRSVSTFASQTSFAKNSSLKSITKDKVVPKKGIDQKIEDSLQTATMTAKTAVPSFMNERKSKEIFRKLPPLSPLSTMLTTAKATVITPRLDPGDFSKLQYLGAVSAVKKGMEDLIGPMKPEVNAKFQEQWAAIYNFPADECVTYLNNAAPILGEVLSLRGSMIKVIQGYDNFINQAQMANFVGNPEASHELMRRAGQSAALLKSLERKMNETIKRFAALGDLPDVEKIKTATAQSY